MRAQLAEVSKRYGAQTVLEAVDLVVGPLARIGLVGPNGVGKSTLLRLLAGSETPDSGTVTRAPASLTAGYLAQTRCMKRGETLLETLARRTGVTAADVELQDAAGALARGDEADDRYATALERYLTLGGDSLEARAHGVCGELGLAVGLERPAERLSGGEAARVALAAILLSRFDLLLLDEPTNDLDFDGLERLETFFDAYEGALVVVSHDRALLDRTVSSIVEIDPASHRAREWTGGWTDYATARDAERRGAWARFERGVARRRDLTALLGKRRTEARGLGASLGKETGGADRRATHALQTKVRQAERLLERNEVPEKPHQPWELRLSFEAADRPGDLVVALEDALAVRGSFRLGPLSVDLAPAERLSVAGRNGAGKTTLLGMLTGDVELDAGRRLVGRRTTIGVLGQDRAAYAGESSLLEIFRQRTGLAVEPARTLLAKLGLVADHVGRPGSLLSPGERTRAELAELQARRVNLLVLDEPTNHLDLEAVEELEAALVSYEGTLVVVSHDRRFLEAVAATREIRLG